MLFGLMNEINAFRNVELRQQICSQFILGRKLRKINPRLAAE